MRDKDEYEILLHCIFECEMLSKLASDISIRTKCAELAIEYRARAERMKAGTDLSMANHSG